jgi:two-component system response regulator FixJ
MNSGAGVLYIVDDDPSLRRALERLAQSLGLDARSFATGAEFLAGDHDERPGCVLLDLRLPDMHGLEVQRRLTQTHPDLRVVIITAYGDDLLRREALDEGAVAVLAKPFDDQSLRQAIARALAGPPARTES